MYARHFRIANNNCEEGSKIPKNVCTSFMDGPQYNPFKTENAKV